MLGDYYLGVDPGKEGGLCLLSYRQRIILLEPMPPTMVDLRSLLRSLPPKTRAVIERQSTRPSQSSSRALTQGRGWGWLEMGLVMQDVPMQDVRPQDWVRAMKIPPKRDTESKPQWKERLRAKAQQLFPRLELWTMPKTRCRQLAVCDALLIALYCWETNP